MKSTLLFAGVLLSAFSQAQLFCESSFESNATPSYSTTYTIPGYSLAGVLGGQGSGTYEKAWTATSISSFAGTMFQVSSADARTGTQSVRFDSLNYLATADWSQKTTTYHIDGTLDGANSGVVISQVWVKQTSSDPSRIGAGISVGAAPNPPLNTLSPEFAGLFFGGDRKIYLRTAQTTTLGAQLKQSTLPVQPLNTWVQLMLVSVPSTRFSTAYVNGVAAFPGTGVTAPVTTLQNIGQANLWAYAFGTAATSLGVPSGGGYNDVFYDDFQFERVEFNTVRGRADLQDFVGNPQTIEAMVEIRTSPLVPTEGTLVSLTRYSEWTSFANTPGTYSVWVKPFHFLAKRFDNTQIDSIGTYFVNGSFVNGDVDNDNEVGSSDFDEVVAQFGEVGNPADLDGDDEVGASDFDIVVRNFGMSGDI